MEHNLNQTIALLERTPAALDALLRGLPESWTMSDEGRINGEESWNARRVVAHLIYCERFNWIPRAKCILEHGESRAFEHFDRHVTFDQPLDELLTMFAQERTESLAALCELNVTAEDLAKRGLHSQFGPVTLSNLLATWAAHDMTHLHQISRILAHQYGEAVGPWSVFLGVLHCNGHSAPLSSR